MANLRVSSQELDAILGELEGELNGILANTQAGLKKAREEDGSPSPGMGSASASAGSPSAGGSPAPEGEGSPGGDPGMDPTAGGDPAAMGAPAGDPGMDPGASAGGPPAGDPGMDPAAGGAPGGDPAMGGEAGGAMDPQALEAEYAQLPLEELKAHYLAAKAALYAQMQGGGEAGAGAGAPPAGPPGAPAGAPPAGPSAGAPPAGPSAGAPPPGEEGPPMAMGEGKAVPGVSQSGNGGQMGKSEAALQAQVDALTKIVTAFVNKPMQKAITGTTYVAKNEGTRVRQTMNSAEVTAKLSELTRSPELKKSDRDLITGYYEGRTNLDAIEHLLK